MSERERERERGGGGREGRGGKGGGTTFNITKINYSRTKEMGGLSNMFFLE